MSISNQSLYSTRILQSLLEALRNLRHAVERASTNPEYLSDGLQRVLTAVRPHLARAMNHSGRETEAEKLQEAISCVERDRSVSMEAAVRLLIEIDQLLICLPLDNRSVVKKRRMSKSEAVPKIREYLRNHTGATRPEVAEAVGCSQGTVYESVPWRARVKERKADRKPRGKKIGLDLALNEKAQRNYCRAKMNALDDK